MRNQDSEKLSFSVTKQGVRSRMSGIPKLVLFVVYSEAYIYSVINYSHFTVIKIYSTDIAC